MQTAEYLQKSEARRIRYPPVHSSCDLDDLLAQLEMLIAISLACSAEYLCCTDELGTV